MASKACTKCGLVKPEEGFPKIAGGRRAQCKACIYTIHRARYAALPVEVRRALNEKSPPSDPAKKALSNKNWKANNPEKVRRHGGLRHAPSLKAQPRWASKPALEAIYTRALLLTAVTGVKHEVDHIIPLRGENVCGLHVPENLQAIPKRENQLKGYKYEPDAHASH